MKHRSRLLPFPTAAVWAAGVLLVFGEACSSSEDQKDTIPSQRGFVMPEGGGSAISEEEACELLATAVRQRRAAINCAASELDCPAYIRPAGGPACYEYDEATVTACAQIIAGYRACADFDLKRCIVTAIPATGAPGCEAEEDSGADVEADAGSDAADGDGGADAENDAGSDAEGDSSTDSGDAAGE
jgi:hypothetical protein